jgi:hypothetical protein
MFRGDPHQQTFLSRKYKVFTYVNGRKFGCEWWNVIPIGLTIFPALRCFQVQRRKPWSALCTLQSNFRIAHDLIYRKREIKWACS